jgi:type IX secretion system PorP/SprF family membrane protein
MNKFRKKITHTERRRFIHIALFFAAKNIIAKNLQYIVTVYFLAISGHALFGQDLRFTQFHASDTWINPAFAGIKGKARLQANFRDQWPAIPQTYVSYRIAFDALLYEINSGVGLFAIRDDEGQSVLQTLQIGGQYNYQLQLSGKLAFNAGLQAVYVQKSIDWNELQFFDQINPVYGFTDAAGNPNPTAQVPPPSLSLTYADFAAGALFYSNKWFAGFSAHHLTRPEQSFYSESNSRLPMSLTMQTGLLLFNEQKINPMIINPVMVFTIQNDAKLLSAGSYFKANQVLLGMFAKYNFKELSDLSGLVGLQKGWTTLAYNYDLALGSLAGESGGAHEVSAVVLFEPSSTKIKTRRQKHALDCPGIL